MLVSLDDFKDYAGITSFTYDTFIEGQLQLVSDTVEAYCRRKFESATYTQIFYKEDFDANSNSLTLFHYPLTSITSIKLDDELVTDFRAHYPTGIITLDNGRYFFGEKVEVVYTAGFTQIPSILKHVVNSIVEEKYNKKSSGVSLNFGSDVQRVSIPGTISIDYDYTLTANDRINAYGNILGNYLNMLDGFRSERIVGPGQLSYGV